MKDARRGPHSLVEDDRNRHLKAQQVFLSAGQSGSRSQRTDLSWPLFDLDLSVGAVRDPSAFPLLFRSGLGADVTFTTQ